MGQLEAALLTTKRDYELLRIEFERTVASNEQAAPIARELQVSYSSIQCVYIMKQIKILCGQLNLADISTRCFSHPQGNYVYMYVIFGHVRVKIKSAFLWVFCPLPR